MCVKSLSRRSIMAGIASIFGLSASPARSEMRVVGRVPSAQEEIVYPRAALTELWPLIRRLRDPVGRGLTGFSIDEMKKDILYHFETYGIVDFPAMIEGAAPDQPVTILGLNKNARHYEANISQDELVMSFTYWEPKEQRFRASTSHVAFGPVYRR